ncbi:MAG: PhoX family protein [Planctomycetes bacterium]|nr:PhoX family protein [Planctomycetota bacterium]
MPDPLKVFDLPAGFEYVVLSSTGERMTDGLSVPAGHDGMAAFTGPDGLTLVVRNHELDARQAPAFGRVGAPLAGVDPAKLYDAGHGRTPSAGGTTTLVYDTRGRRLVRHFLSLGGTVRNCAGGPTPWGSWITCEEAVVPVVGPYARDHGWCFEVPATAEPVLHEAVPLRGLGRFNHEAAAVDPRTGIVYLTEDRHDGLLYRFVPERPGSEGLRGPGRLQALAIRGRPGASTKNAPDTVVPVGGEVAVRWVDLDGADAPDDDLRYRGHAAGAAQFSRGEGLWWGGDALFVCCTSGGRSGKGQVWRLTPGEGRDDRLALVLEPNDPSVLDHCDNVTVAPWGDLVLCEDGPGDNGLVGVTPDGRAYRLGRNAANESELCGACFSPDGTTLFVNVQRPGYTLAITGPWRRVG